MVATDNEGKHIAEEGDWGKQARICEGRCPTGPIAISHTRKLFVDSTMRRGTDTVHTIDRYRIIPPRFTVADTVGFVLCDWIVKAARAFGCHRTTRKARGVKNRDLGFCLTRCVGGIKALYSMLLPKSGMVQNGNRPPF